METPDMSDFRISEHGSILAIKPVSDATRQWLNENVVTEPWQWIDGALCVEFRFARDLIAEIDGAGLRICPDRSAGRDAAARPACGIQTNPALTEGKETCHGSVSSSHLHPSRRRPEPPCSRLRSQGGGEGFSARERPTRSSRWCAPAAATCPPIARNRR
jgi:hypothetical protein